MAPPTADGHSGPKRPKVIYVMGAGRSGSTILGVALGNCADVFFAGELDKWLPREGAPKRKDRERAEFWRTVKTRVADPATVRAGQPHRYLERSSALFRLSRRGARRRLRGPYRRVMSELYGAVASTAGTAYVVDTSHYPLRARELQALSSVDLYLLLLVRDPQDVVASFAKDDVAERRFNPFTTRVYLLLTYLLSSWVFLKQPRESRMVLFYEDLLADPQGVLADLLARVGSGARVPDLTTLATGIPLHGNRLIDAASVSLKPSQEPREEKLSGGRLFAGLLTGGLARLRPRVSARAGGERARQSATTTPR
jgi:hypothetical protein